MRLLLDEHYDREIAQRLHEQHGHDVRAVNGDPGVAAMSDAELLAHASQVGRVLVTENVADFMPLHRQAVASGQHHGGLIFTNPRRFPRDRRAMGQLIAALDAYLRGPGARADLSDDVHWL